MTIVPVSPERAEHDGQILEVLGLRTGPYDVRPHPCNVVAKPCYFVAKPCYFVATVSWRA
jgi:hypothetical protein